MRSGVFRIDWLWALEKCRLLALPPLRIQWGGTFCEPGNRPSLDIRSARIIRTLILGFLAAITRRNALLFKPSSLICYRDGLDVLRKPFFKKHLKKTLLCVYACVHTHVCTCRVCVPVSMRTPVDSMLVEVRTALWSRGLGLNSGGQVCAVSTFAYWAIPPA